MRPTLSQFRAQWPAEATGVCQADPQVVAYCNEAQEKLMIDVLCPDEGWAFGWVTLNLTATVNNGSAYVTVPQEISRLIVTDVCKHPVRIRNAFWEFMEFGHGLQPKTCRSGCGSPFSVYERDNVVTLTDLVGTKTVRMYPSDVRDTGRRILLQGKDQNGMTILTTDPGTGLSAPGEYVQFQFPFSNSVNQFSTITGIQKDQCWGVIQIFQVDPVSGVETPLSSMEPNDGSSWFRRYLVSGIPSTNLCCASPASPLQLTAQGRLDFRPVASETDYLTIACIPALKEECLSIRYGNMDSANAAQQSMMHHAKAIGYLNGQLDSVYGKVNTAVRVPIWGSQKLRRQPV